MDAEQAVVAAALQRGYLSQAQLDQAVAQQRALAAQGQPAPLLRLLAAFLTPPQQAALRNVFQTAQQQAAPPDPAMGAMSAAPPPPAPGLAPPRPSPAPPPAAPLSPHFVPSALVGPPPSARLAFPAGQEERISLGNLPDDGEVTLQLDARAAAGTAPGYSPDGATVTQASAPPPSNAFSRGSTSGGWQTGAPPGSAPGQSASSWSGPSQAPELPQPGDMIARYRVVNVLAQGGMGVVYEAFDEALNRRAAVKLMLETGDDQIQATLFKRFVIEARESANLSHPNIAAVFGAGRDSNDRPYLAMEFLEGETLKARVKRQGALTGTELAELGIALAGAVDYAHQMSVLHRDLKPSNILITNAGVPKLVDFGLAKNVDANSHGLTKTGEVMGTPAYMPPEQASGTKHEIGKHSDVWGLGATLYFAATGRAPFQGASVVNIISQVLNDDPPAPRALNPALEPDLEAILLKCLEKDIAERYESAGALARDFQAFLGPGKGVEAKRKSRLGRKIARHRQLIALGAVGVVGVAVAVAVALHQPDPSGRTLTASPSLRPKPSTSPDAAPDAKLREIVTIDAKALADAEVCPALCVYNAPMASVEPGGVRWRSSQGLGPAYAVPGVYRRGVLRVRAKLKVRSLQSRARIGIALMAYDKAFPPVYLDLGTHLSGVGAHPLFNGFVALRMRFNDTVEFGAEYRLDPSTVLDHFGWKSRIQPGVVPVALELRVAGDGRAELRLDDESVEVPFALPKGPCLILLGAWDSDGAASWDSSSDVVVESFEVAGERDGFEFTPPDANDYARVGRLGRLALTNATYETLQPELLELSRSREGPVRMLSVLLNGTLQARQGQSELAFNTFKSFYHWSYATLEEIHRKRPQRGTPVFPVRLLPSLHASAHHAIARAHLDFFKIRDDFESLGRDAARYDPTRVSSNQRTSAANERLVCMIARNNERADASDPADMGAAWIYAGNFERAYALLAPLAQAAFERKDSKARADVDALLWAGFAAYLVRRYPEAKRWWEEVDRRDSKRFAGDTWWSSRYRFIRR